MSFSYIVLFLFTFPLLLLQLLQNPKISLLLSLPLPLLPLLSYYFATNTLLQILSYPGVVELTTQLLILENILWLPLRRINKFGLTTLPSKAVAIPYTCGLSGCSGWLGCRSRGRRSLESGYGARGTAPLWWRVLSLEQLWWVVRRRGWRRIRETMLAWEEF